MNLRKTEGVALVATLLQLGLLPTGVACHARCEQRERAAVSGAQVVGGCHHGSVLPAERFDRAKACSDGKCCSIQRETQPALRDSRTLDLNPRSGPTLALFTVPNTDAPILSAATVARGTPAPKAVPDLLCRGLASLRI